MSAEPFVARLRKNTRPRDAIVLGIVLLAISAVLVYVLGVRSVRVHFVNGLDVPVTIDVSGRSVAVPPGAEVPSVLDPGVYDVTVRVEGGRVLETSALHVPARVDAVAFNVLGAAPIFLAEAVYSASPGGEGNGKPTFLGARHSFAMDDVDYVFVDPPRSLEAKSGSQIRKRYVKLLPGGWTVTFQYLRSTKMDAEAAALAEAVARATPTQKSVSYVLDGTRAAFGEGSSLGFLTAILRDHPTDDYVANVIVFAACRTEHCDLARAVLEDVARTTPPSPERAVLLGSLGSESDARSALADAVRAHESDPELQRRAARLALIDGRYQECAAGFARAESAPDASSNVDDQVRCLIALGRIGEALDVAAATAKKEARADNAWNAAITYARAASMKGAPGKRDPFEFTRIISTNEQMDNGVAAARDRLWIARPVSEDVTTLHEGPLQNAVKLAVAALDGPGAAWEAASAHDDAFAALPDPLLIVLGAEFVRAGSPNLGRKVLASGARVALSARALEDYVLTGTQDPRFWRIDPEERAALDYVRARHLDSLGEPSAAALYNSARAHDVMAGWVTRLYDAWPRPAKAKPGDFVIVPKAP